MVRKHKMHLELRNALHPCTGKGILAPGLLTCCKRAGRVRGHVCHVCCSAARAVATTAQLGQQQEFIDAVLPMVQVRRALGLPARARVACPAARQLPRLPLLMSDGASRDTPPCPSTAWGAAPPTHVCP